MSRCVRKAFLCGSDSTGRSFEHRRGWIEHLLIEQAKVFCIDIAAYAVMSNHFHIVLHVNQSKTRDLTDLEVVQRWHQLYKGSFITQKFERGEELSEAQLSILEDIINDWRDREKPDSHSTNNALFSSEVNSCTVLVRTNYQEASCPSQGRN